jgi:hypothetical protein
MSWPCAHAATVRACVLACPQACVPGRASVPMQDRGQGFAPERGGVQGLFRVRLGAVYGTLGY